MGDNLANLDGSIRRSPPNSHSPPHSGVLAPIPAASEHEQKQEKEADEKTDEIWIRELAAQASGVHKEFGQAVASLFLIYEKKSNELKILNKVVNELRTEKEFINGQLIESKEQNVRCNGKIQELQKKAELIVQRAKSKETILRKRFTELIKKHRALKKELDEMDNNIRLLKEKDTDNETKITEQNVQVLNFEIAERKFKKELDEKEEQLECFSKRVVQGEMSINELEEKVADLESLKIKLNKELDDEGEHIEVLEGKLKEKCDQNEIAMQELETNCKLRVQELEAKISEKSNEISIISDELDKEREKINGQIKVLYEQVKVLKKGDKVTMRKLKTERDELKLENKYLQTKLETILETAQSSVILEKPKVQHKQTVSCSSSSSEDETSPESSPSSSNTEDADNENVRNSAQSEAKRLEPLVVSKLFPNKTPGKRKNSPKIVSSAVKKQRKDANSSTDHNAPQNKLVTFTQISQIHFNQKSNTEGNTEIPEKSGTSRVTRSRSGRKQGNQADNTQ